MTSARLFINTRPPWGNKFVKNYVKDSITKNTQTSSLCSEKLGSKYAGVENSWGRGVSHFEVWLAFCNQRILFASAKYTCLLPALEATRSRNTSA